MYVCIPHTILTCYLHSKQKRAANCNNIINNMKGARLYTYDYNNRKQYLLIFSHIVCESQRDTN